jgi:hypothetical protein
MITFLASENFDAFIGFHSSQPTAGVSEKLKLQTIQFGVLVSQKSRQFKAIPQGRKCRIPLLILRSIAAA